MTGLSENMDAVTEFIATIQERNIPSDIFDLARKAVTDSIGVAIGAHNEEAGQSIRRVAAKWSTSGNAQIVLGGTAAPAVAALINGTLGHCLDYDDTHVCSLSHLSNPTWAAALAVGAGQDADEMAILQAYIAGFEVGARLGGNNFGQSANERGLHATGIFGCFAAATAASRLLNLNKKQTACAIGAAATQTGGLTGSFGTMSKPFHAGKAAMNGVLSAELAAEGFTAQTSLLDDGGLANALVQDRAAGIGNLNFNDGWELAQNTYKPYAACLLTHPVIDAARSLSGKVDGSKIASVTIHINPICAQLAGKPAPTTPLEGKFSTAYCAALGLNGHLATEQDFATVRLTDRYIQEAVQKTKLRPDGAIDLRAARLEVEMSDGSVYSSQTETALGNPGNPMSWANMRAKFDALVQPVLGAATDELFDILKNFGSPGDLARMNALIAR